MLLGSSRQALLVQEGPLEPVLSLQDTHLNLLLLTTIRVPEAPWKDSEERLTWVLGGSGFDNIYSEQSSQNKLPLVRWEL